MIDTGFIRFKHAGILIHAEDIDTLIEAMAAYQPHETIFRMKAENL
jgi:hypothetical protein